MVLFQTWSVTDAYSHATDRSDGRCSSVASIGAHRPDIVAWDAVQHEIKDLDDVLVFLLGSRYCDTDRLGDFA